MCRRRPRRLAEPGAQRLNHKKLRRFYCEEGRQVRRRGGRKRALGTMPPIWLGSLCKTSYERQQCRNSYKSIKPAKKWVTPWVGPFYANGRIRNAEPLVPWWRHDMETQAT
jgi:hypothetical protein